MWLAWSCFNPASSLLGADDPPSVAWQWTMGGSSNDFLFQLEEFPEGGFLLCGYSSSPTGPNKTGPNRGGTDYWVVRLNEQGSMIWDQTYGGLSDDFLVSGQRTADGGVLVGGTSLSGVSGNKQAPAWGLRDYWVVRLDDQGNPLWDRAFGGSSSDYLQTAKPAANQTFLLGGYSFSSASGNKSSPGFGLFDYWIVAIDANGTKVWDKAFGGGNHDYLLSLEPTPDGGCLAAGYSYSGVEGNKTSANSGGADFWVLRLDSGGNKLWEATYGGTAEDILRVVRSSGDGGYLLAGQSASPVSGTKSSPNYGGSDFWVVRIDGSGNKLWDQSYGGTGSDQLWSFVVGMDGELAMGGWSDSGPSGNKTNPGYGLSDFWIVSAGAQGIKRWDQSLGGTQDEVALSLCLCSDGGILAGGYSFSGVEGNKTAPNLGESDFWLVKLNTQAGPAGPFVIHALPQSTDDIDERGFRFLLSGPIQRRYALEYSTNLTQWVRFESNILTVPTTEVIDRHATNQSQRFYRAVAE